MMEHPPGYILLREIGKGGMGVVYLARQTSLDRLVAVKVVRIPDGPEAELSRRFRREASILKRLSHPTIARLLDFELDARPPFLVSEYVEDARNLGQWFLQTGPSPETIILKCQEITAGLAYIHQEGIVHRDLKPGNILVDRWNNAKIIDYGLARRIDADATQITLEGAILGTYSYMSPEQLRGEEADQRSDVYSLGLIFCELLAGKNIFCAAAQDRIGPTQRAVADMPTLSALGATVPSEVERLVARCVSREPDERPADGSTLLEELDRIVTWWHPEARQSPGGSCRSPQDLTDRIDGPLRKTRQRIGALDRTAHVAGPHDSKRPLEDDTPRPVPLEDPRHPVPDAPNPDEPPRRARGSRRRRSVWSLAPIGLGLAFLLGFSVVGRTWGRWHVEPEPIARSSAGPSALMEAQAEAKACLDEILKVEPTGLEGLISRLDEPLRRARYRGRSAEALGQVVGPQRLLRLEQTLEKLSWARSMVDCHDPPDCRLLTALSQVRTIDDVFESVGMPTVLTEHVEGLLGVFGEILEYPALAPDTPTFGVLLKSSSLKDDQSANWVWSLPALPRGDPWLVVVLNDFDPKTVLQVTLNSIVRVHFRNRNARTGGQPYVVPSFQNVVTRTVSGQGRFGALTPYHRLVVLARRVPRSVFVPGQNIVGLKFLHLPGPLRLPSGKVWSVSLGPGSLWGAFLTFPAGPIQGQRPKPPKSLRGR